MLLNDKFNKFATHMERKIINRQNVLKVVINDGVLIVNLLYMETKLA